MWKQRIGFFEIEVIDHVDEDQCCRASVVSIHWKILKNYWLFLADSFYKLPKCSAVDASKCSAKVTSKDQAFREKREFTSRFIAIAPIEAVFRVAGRPNLPPRSAGHMDCSR